MIYRLLIHRSAQKALAAIPRDDFQSVVDAILALANNPRPHRCKKLINKDGWRIRVGTYRIIYDIDDPQRSVTVTKIGHRRDVYL